MGRTYWCGIGVMPVLVSLLGACAYAGAVTPYPTPQTPRCTITATGIHNVASSGPGSSTVIRRSETLLACAGGPLISLTGVTSAAVNLRDGGDAITISAGSDASVGPYQVTVHGIDGGTAAFTLALPA